MLCTQEHHNLDKAQMEAIVAEMSIGLEQEHSSIIQCYRCWLDRRAHCINLITEFFTSGNLRDYRQRHKHLELKAVKKWARQVRRAAWSGTRSNSFSLLEVTAAVTHEGMVIWHVSQ